MSDFKKILDPKEYYKIRDGGGRFPEYTPDGFLEKYNEYAEWVQSNNLKEEQLFHYQGKVVHGEAKKMRSFSIEGFCNFAEIVVNTFKNYEEREEFLIVTSRIRQAIALQQFEGAAGGFLNPSIMASKLGLANKLQHANDPDNPMPSAIKVNLNDLDKDEKETIAKAIGIK